MVDKNINLLLKEKFDFLRSKNAAYSLRSFAKRLKIHPAAMSEILRGKREVSTRLVERIVSCSLFDELERNQILQNLKTKRRLLEIAQRPLRQSIELDLDKYYLVSDWYYYSILSLSETKDFIGKSNWISERLGISPKVVQKALTRLTRLGYFKKNRQATYTPIQVSLTTTQDIPSKALQRRHEQNLDAARESLQQDQILDREFTFITMSVDKTKMIEAKKMIREFRDKLCSYLEEGEKTEVYELAIQLFPRTKLKER